MVIQDGKKLVSFLDDFDPKDAADLQQLEALVLQFPNFHLIRAYYLKALQQQQSDGFDKALSHTAIATYDRELLYHFIETPLKKAKKKKTTPKAAPSESSPTETKPTKITLEKKSLSTAEEGTRETATENRRFSEWATYLKSRKTPEKQPEKQPEITAKFELIDAFLAKQNKIVPDTNTKNTEDLSEKSWAAPDELMTETLAKVFVKQKKYNKALEAYQILGLKYPEKNSFFADQIKEIKRLQKLKE